MLKDITGKMVRKCLEESHDGFMISDAKGIILYANEAYRKLTKLNERAKPGTSLRELVEQNDIDSSTCLEAIQRKRVFTSVHLDYAHDGVILSASKPMFDANGQIELVVTNIRDTSEFFDLKHDLEAAHRTIIALSKKMEGTDDQDKEVISVSSRMQNTLSIARKASGFDVAVLIQGESGVGKEVVAKYIHNYSLRRDKPFLVINCGAIPVQLLETELFGYAEGTFTGQTRGGKPGLLSAAKGGTLFLDEIGDMPLQMQVKLLRVLETNTYTPVGSSQLQKADVRFISATNRPLKQMVKEGTFREDLYYRLNVVAVDIAPLRQRKEDIIPLAMFFLDQCNRKYHLHKVLPLAVFSDLQNYAWPGNIRELKNAIETMTVLSPDNYLELPDNVRKNGLGQKRGVTERSDWEVGDLSTFVDIQEKNYLIYCYQKCGTTRKMAEALNVNHSTIIRKLKKHGIKSSQE